MRDWYSSLDAKHSVINSHAYQLLHAVFATAVSDGLVVANPVPDPPCHGGVTQTRSRSS